MSSEDTLLRTLLVIVAVIVLAPLLVMLFMMPMMGMWGWGHMWDAGAWNGTGATWVWIVVWLVFLLVLVGLGYVLYRAVRRSDYRAVDPALEELRIAYARGEISEEEFEARRDRLRREQ